MDTPAIKLEHSDDRGEIYSIALPDDRELMLLFSRADSFRGGHSHDCDEIVILLSGKMRYTKRNFGMDLSHVVNAGESSFNRAGEIHMAEFLEDSWVMEWKFARKGDWTQEEYEPYRAKVRAIAAGG